MIIDGYLPSLDILPDDTHPKMIKILKDCWSSKAYERPTLEKIISLLTKSLQFSDKEEEIKPNLSFSSFAYQ